MFTAKGRSVADLAFDTRWRTRSTVGFTPVPTAPRPPAFDTAIANSAMAVMPIPALKIGYFNPNSAMRALARGVGMVVARCAVAVRPQAPKPAVAAATCSRNSRRSDDMVDSPVFWPNK